MQVYEAYEVFSLGRSYHYRTVFGVFWLWDTADLFKQAEHPYARIGKIYVAYLDGQWRRVLVGRVKISDTLPRPNDKRTQTSKSRGPATSEVMESIILQEPYEYGTAHS